MLEPSNVPPISLSPSAHDKIVAEKGRVLMPD
jgi:hypothetical protein